MARSISMTAAGLLVAGLVASAPVLAGGGKEHGYAFGTSDDFSYVLVEGDKSSVSGSGDMSDYAKARRLKEHYSDFLWVKVEGREYVITDPVRHEKAREAMEPVRMLGKAQGRLGQQQGKLGARQGKLGAEQGRLGRRQGQLGLRMAEINLAIANRERRGTSTRALRRELEEVEAEMEHLSEQMSHLGAVQSTLGQQQTPLGREQGRLGEKQSEASRKMAEEIRRIVDDAIEDGDAIPIR